MERFTSIFAGARIIRYASPLILLMSCWLATSAHALSFKAPAEYPTPNGAIVIDSADMDRDGNPDIVTINRDDDSASVMLFNRAGSVRSRIDTRLYGEFDEPTFLKLGDFNRDGKTDVVASSYGNRIAAMLGSGNGTFRWPHRFYEATMPDYFQGIQSGDINHDGREDIVAIGTWDSYRFFSRWDGTFRVAEPFSTIDFDNPVGAFLLTDFTRDGNLDLIISSAGNSFFLLYNGSPNGTFSPGPRYYPSNGQYINAFVVGDLNHDAKEDIVTTDQGKLFVSLGNGDFTFNDGPILEIPGKYIDHELKLGDIDGDGHTDIIVTVEGSFGTGIAVFLGNGDGTFVESAILQPGRPYAIEDFAIVDINSDGRTDIVGVGGNWDSSRRKWSNSAITVWLNDTLR